MPRRSNSPPGKRSNGQMNRIKPAVRWGLSVLSAGLLILSFQPFGLWPLAWFAAVPVLLAAMDCPDAKAAANLGAFAGLVFYGVSINWLTRIFGPVAIAFWCLFALWPALWLALLWKLWNDPLLRGRAGLRGPVFAVAAGLLWAGIEYFRCEVWWLECAWLALGYSQTPAHALLQSASLIGGYGLSALIMSVNAAFALALKERRAAPAALAAALLAGLALWGAARVRSFPAEAGKRLQVALVQDETYNLDKLVSMSLGKEAKDADLLIWPEYSYPVQPGQDGKYFDMLVKRLRGSKATAMIGAAVHTDDLKKNRAKNFAWFISPDGGYCGRYDKLHPIPYIEKRLRPGPKNLVPNPVPGPIKTPAGLLGVQICYDLDFENGSRLMASKGAQLLAVNNLDPEEWGRWQHLQHSAMAPMRAVESGLWLVRAASSGWSQIMDPLGRVRASLPMGETGVLAGTAFLSEPGTFYSRCGWLFAPVCFVLAVLAAAICACPVKLFP